MPKPFMTLWSDETTTLQLHMWESKYVPGHVGATCTIHFPDSAMALDFYNAASARQFVKMLQDALIEAEFEFAESQQRTEDQE